MQSPVVVPSWQIQRAYIRPWLSLKSDAGGAYSSWNVVRVHSRNNLGVSLTNTRLWMSWILEARCFLKIMFTTCKAWKTLKASKIPGSHNALLDHWGPVLHEHRIARERFYTSNVWIYCMAIWSKRRVHSKNWSLIRLSFAMNFKHSSEAACPLLWIIWPDFNKVAKFGKNAEHAHQAHCVAAVRPLWK